MCNRFLPIRQTSNYPKGIKAGVFKPFQYTSTTPHDAFNKCSPIRASGPSLSGGVR